MLASLQRHISQEKKISIKSKHEDKIIVFLSKKVTKGSKLKVIYTLSDETTFCCLRIDQSFKGVLEYTKNLCPG